jgi:hypothetical protein
MPDVLFSTSKNVIIKGYWADKHTLTKNSCLPKLGALTLVFIEPCQQNYTFLAASMSNTSDAVKFN